MALLVGKADTLSRLVNAILESRPEASAHPAVLDSVSRLCRIQTLLEARNFLRLAIELCSESGIKLGLKRRAKVGIVGLPACLPACLPVCLSVCLSVCLTYHLTTD